MKRQLLIAALALVQAGVFKGYSGEVKHPQSRHLLTLKMPGLTLKAPLSLIKSDQDSRIITGTVTDNNNMPIPGANVTVTGTDTGTTTDFDGNFTLEVPDDATTLTVSYLGFKSQQVTIDNISQVNVALQEDVSNLEEVIVTGYGTESRKNVTASIASIDPAEITSIPTSDVSEMLEGRLPGVQIMSDNSPGGGNSIRVRGFGTINNNDPLVVVDGVPVSNGLNGINPADIETIQVLKDAASSSIYGSRAANGVVVITTKKEAKTGPTKSIWTFMQACNPRLTSPICLALSNMAICYGRPQK